MGDDILLRNIGQRISERRKELHLTQEKLAEQMDVSIQMISNLELGKKAIRPENLVKVCNVLEVSADYILTGMRSDHEIMELTEKIARLPEERQKIIVALVDNLLEL